MSVQVFALSKSAVALGVTSARGETGACVPVVVVAVGSFLEQAVRSAAKPTELIPANAFRRLTRLPSSCITFLSINTCTDCAWKIDKAAVSQYAVTKLPIIVMSSCSRLSQWKHPGEVGGMARSLLVTAGCAVIFTVVAVVRFQPSEGKAGTT
ncbi:hypothetical protein [Sinosporangium siamense]|uniref:hypothetical protein n=1 Tax=Sinosporangium siamense TaxID=1367973 RepID=UPI00194F92A2|nr:hypothetical protein [Sinosporangium siamense]